MGIEMRSARVKGWRITFKQVLKNGKVYTCGAKCSEAKTRAGVMERFAKFRAGQEAKGNTFIDVSDAFTFNEERHFLMF
jgi:hypothetical protein